jgi:hypothetical protein
VAAVDDFNSMALKYSHKVQAESKEALEPLAEILGTLAELGGTDLETCDSDAFAECLANTYWGNE